MDNTVAIFQHTPTKQDNFSNTHLLTSVIAVHTFVGAFSV